jgi:N-acetylglucosaminyl-diphospho-decaprenol L-rhamnosyltransferase
MADSDSDVPTLAIVTVSFNSAEVLGPFLDSIRAASTGSPRVVVVDNASSEIEAVRAAVAGCDAQLLELPQNLGYGTAMNRGVSSLPTTVEWVLLSNPDVILQPRALDELVSGAQLRDDAGALGPRVLQPDGSVYPSARRLPSLRNGIGHALFGRAIPRNPWTRRYRADELPTGEPRVAGWLSGSCLLVRRSAFAAVGGFDEGYFMYFEDVDLGARLARAGYTSVYWPAAVVTHTGAHSTASRAAAMEKAHHVSAYRYVARKYSAWYLWPVRVVLRVGIFARGLVVSRG